jgi:hypothetical protein
MLDDQLAADALHAERPSIGPKTGPLARGGGGRYITEKRLGMFCAVRQNDLSPLVISFRSQTIVQTSSQQRFRFKILSILFLSVKAAPRLQSSRRAGMIPHMFCLAFSHNIDRTIC